MEVGGSKLPNRSDSATAACRTTNFHPLGTNCQRSPYFDSLCGVCFRQKRQYLLISSRSVVFRLFFVVL